MAVLLFFIAAGQVMLGTYYLMSGHMFGYCSVRARCTPRASCTSATLTGLICVRARVPVRAQVWVNDRPWYMQPVWTIQCCVANDAQGNEFWLLSRAIVGYTVRARGEGGARHAQSPPLSSGTRAAAPLARSLSRARIC